MTDLAGALANNDHLPDYGGRKVTRTAIKITNAGDGLSQGLAIDPTVYELGDVVHVVLRCVVDSHEMDRVLDKGSDTGLLVLQQVLKAGDAAIVDADVVREAIDSQAEKIRLAKEAAKGIKRLPFGDELQKAHEEGRHAGELVYACPDCEALAAATGQEMPDAPADDEAEDTPPAEPTSIAGRSRKRS